MSEPKIPLAYRSPPAQEKVPAPPRPLEPSQPPGSAGRFALLFGMMGAIAAGFIGWVITSTGMGGMRYGVLMTCLVLLAFFSSMASIVLGIVSITDNGRSERLGIIGLVLGVLILLLGILSPIFS